MKQKKIPTAPAITDVTGFLQPVIIGEEKSKLENELIIVLSDFEKRTGKRISVIEIYRQDEEIVDIKLRVSR